MTMQAYQGSCHCGAIKFTFEAEPISKGVRCNCSFCSKRGTMIHLGKIGDVPRYFLNEQQH